MPTTTTPATADTTPTTRIRSAGVWAASSIARRTAAGKAAQRSPSMASASPSAATRSRTVAVYWPDAGAGWPAGAPCAAAAGRGRPWGSLK